MTNSKKVFYFLILVAVLVSLFFRLYDITIDPFPASVTGASWYDEGAYAHNARNKILFQNWTLEYDNWNPMYISPIHTFLTFISFKYFGVSTFSARVFPVLLGLISIFFVSFILFLKNKTAGLVYLCLLLSNLIMVAYSRVNTLEYV